MDYRSCCKNIIAVFYYLGVVLILSLYNLAIEYANEVMAQTFEATYLFLSPMGGWIVGGYLLLNQWVKPSIWVRIVCKAMLILFFFVGWNFFFPILMPTLSLVSRITILVPVVSGYFLCSLIADIVSLCRKKKYRNTF